MTPQPGGLEATPTDGLPIIVCPNCGHQLPPLAPPASRVAAQTARPTAQLNRAPELEDATPTAPQPVDRRVAPTDRLG